MMMLATFSPPSLLAALPPAPMPTAGGFAMWLPVIVMIVGIVVLGGIMMMVFHRRERQLTSLAAQIASDLEEARALRQQLDEVHTRAANMLGAAQRLGARLDDRMASLDLASLKMHATRTALPRNGAAPAAGATRSTAPAALSTNTTPAKTRPPAPLPPTSVGSTASSSTTGASPADPRPLGVATLEGKPSLDPLTKQVYALADSGRSPVAIARDLNEQVGKIELILALRRQ